MHCTIGTDIIELERIREAIERWGDRFLHRIYTDAELNLCKGNVPSLAARFAGKEAIIKALSLPNEYLGWQTIEIISRKNGKPEVILYSKALHYANRHQLHIEISLSHCREYATATAIATSTDTTGL